MSRFDFSGVKYGRPVLKFEQPRQALQEPSKDLNSGPESESCSGSIVQYHQAISNPPVHDQQSAATNKVLDSNLSRQDQAQTNLKAEAYSRKTQPGLPPVLHRPEQEFTPHQSAPSPTTETLRSLQNLAEKAQSRSNNKFKQQPHTPKLEITPPEDESSVSIDLRQQIEQAREASMRDISGRQRRKDKNATACLKDLDLARTPIDPQRPQASERLWSQNPELVVQDYVKRFDEIPEVPNLHDEPTPQYEVLSNQAVQSSASEDGLHDTSVLGNVLTSHSMAKSSSAKSFELQKSRWASKEEMQSAATAAKTDSNAWGSSLASDSQRAYDASDKSFGKLLHSKNASDDNGVLTDWEGRLLPPHPDWADRPRFNNNNPHFKEWFLKYLSTCDKFALSETKLSNSVPYVVLPPTYLENLDYQADGLGLVKKTVTINASNAQRYGYTDPSEVTEDTTPVQEEDFADWGKLDLKIPLNQRFRNETTETLVSNWLRHIENSRPYLRAYTTLGDAQSEEPSSLQHSPDIKALQVPKLNIYLRPATKADIPELTRIYNWHVKNGPRTAEVYEASEEDMRLRFSSSRNSKLPFIVAAKKCQRGSPAIDIKAEAEAEALRNSNQHLSVQNIGRKHRTVTRVEKLAGWASAQDLTASDYVEHISAEVELYVDAGYRSMGVGRCLLDKLLEVCDKSYVPRGGYDFRCAQELREKYQVGGQRDILKVFFLLRKWTSPKSSDKDASGTKGGKCFHSDEQDDFHTWLGPWLESWQFKVEGILTLVGAKHGRYIDTVYLGRESRWRPNEGKVPNPMLGPDSNEIGGNDG